MTLKLVIIIFIHLVINCYSAEITCKDIPYEINHIPYCCPIITRDEKYELEEKSMKCMKSDDICVDDKCLAKQYNIELNKTLGIDKGAYKKFILSRKTGDVAKLLTEGVDDCFDKPSKDSCKLLGILQCLDKKVRQKCPSSKIWNPNKNMECDIIKAYIDKCGINS